MEKQRQQQPPLPSRIEHRCGKNQPSAAPAVVPPKVTSASVPVAADGNARRQYLAVYQEAAQKGIVSKTAKEAQEKIETRLFPGGE